MERKHQPQTALPGTVGAARHVGTAVALAAAFATLFLSWHRLYYGVDFTDEAFYVALPLRFALGDIPLKDEQSLAQFAGVLVLPLVRLFLWLSGAPRASSCSRATFILASRRWSGFRSSWPFAAPCTGRLRYSRLAYALCSSLSTFMG